MTRDELADAVDYAARHFYKHDLGEHTIERLEAAAALLRQSCAGCRHFAVPRPSVGVCLVPPNNGVLFRPVPADGSGYCWQWKKKETTDER